MSDRIDTKLIRTGRTDMDELMALDLTLRRLDTYPGIYWPDVQRAAVLQQGFPKPRAIISNAGQRRITVH
eukprot:COSAG01_NODE_13716_length_1544_cov_42.601384_1_plen_70_part_00